MAGNPRLPGPHAWRATLSEPVLLPEVLAVYDGDVRCGGVEVVEQARIDPYPAGMFIPTAVGLEVRAVGVSGTPAAGAKMMGYKFRIPPVNSVVGGDGCHVELCGRIIRQ